MEEQNQISFIFDSLVRYLANLYHAIPSSFLLTMAIAFAIWCMIVLIKLKQKNRKIFSFLLFEYLLLFFFSTIVFRDSLEHVQCELIPFWSYSAIMKGRYDLIPEIFMNIIVFIPVGFCLPFSFSRISCSLAFLFAAFISFIIELMQFVLIKGTAEIDDIIHNTIGCLIGYGLGRLCLVVIKMHKSRV